MKYQQLVELVLNTDKEVLKKVIQVDGHTIYDPQKFIDLGLNPKIVKHFTQVFKSQANSPKETIFVDDKPVPSLKGIYGLNLMESIACIYNIRSTKLGRGSRACDLQAQLLEKWK